jgi:hypothetical protein
MTHSTTTLGQYSDSSISHIKIMVEKGDCGLSYWLKRPAPAPCRLGTGGVRCAETEAQAMKEAGYGMACRSCHARPAATSLRMAMPGGDVNGMIAFVHESGRGAIEKPDRLRGSTRPGAGAAGDGNAYKLKQLLIMPRFQQWRGPSI